MSTTLRSSERPSDFDGNRPRVTLLHERSVPLTLLDIFDRIAIINPGGSANGEQAIKGLRALSLDQVPGFIDFIPDVPLARPAGWASRTAGTVFMTHYSVLKQALDRRWKSVLLWDARADFAGCFAARQSEVVHALANTAWDVFFLSYRDASRPAAPCIPERQPNEPQALMLVRSKAVREVSAYAVSRPFLPYLVRAMEAVLENPTQLASPLNPTASAFESDAISLVLSKVLRARPDSLSFAPIAADADENDAAVTRRTRSNVLEFLAGR